MSITVLLPTYNERDNLPLLIEELRAEFSRQSLEHEIIVIDDHSPDGTWEVAQQIEKQCDVVKAIVRTKDKGLASALRVGAESATMNVVCFMDTDFSHPVQDITRMMSCLEGVDSVWASRYIEGGAMLAEKEMRIQRFLSKIFNFYLKFFLNLTITDSTNGFFVIRRLALLKMDLDYVFYGYGDFAFRLAFCLSQAGSLMAEIPFTYQERKFGKGNTKILPVACKYFWESIKLKISR